MRTVTIEKDGNNYIVNPNASGGGGEPYNKALEPDGTWVIGSEPVPAGEILCSIAPSYDIETGHVVTVEGNGVDDVGTLFGTTDFTGSPIYCGSIGNHHFFYGYTG